MNQHPARETAADKPVRPPHPEIEEDHAPEANAADESNQNAEAKEPPALPPVGKISRESAERGIIPDRDPDDPASP